MAVRIRLTAGARDAERALLETVDLALASAGDEPSSFARLGAPIRIVVPSRSLRDHVCSRLLTHRGRAVAGVVVSTHRALAQELVNRVDTRGPGPQPTEADSRPSPPAEAVAGDAALPVAILTRRAAANQPALASVLDEEGRHDPFASVAATVEDLLDAGLEPAHVDALAEWLEPSDGRQATLAIQRRARAVLQVASTTASRLEDTLLRAADNQAETIARAHPTLLLRHAMARIDQWAASGEVRRCLPTRQLIVHGYADATGVVTDFLELLLRTLGGEVIIDLPPEPPCLGSTTSRRARDFPARLRHRLETVATRVEDTHDAASPGTSGNGDPIRLTLPHLVGAADPLAELRAVAMRIRALLDDQEHPESIAVVARDPKPLVRVLRAAFDEYNIPYSASGLRGPLDPPGRLLMGLRELLAAGPTLPIARWLDLVVPDESGSSLTSSQREALRVALHRRGLARIGDASLALLREPASIEPSDQAEESWSWHRARARPHDVLPSLALRLADACCRLLVSWRQAPRTVAEHRRHLLRLLAGPLGWQSPADSNGAVGTDAATVAATDAATDATADTMARPGWAARTRLLEVLENAWGAVGVAAPITFEEAWLLAGEPIGQVSQSALGGRGGGVQILDATEARGRTFEHLFVIGMVRDRFPRRIITDPLLPDSLREAMRSLLPDLAVKRRGHAEERYLFAQLLSAGEHLTLSWSRTDEQGRERAPSSLLMPWLTAPNAPSSSAPSADSAGALATRAPTFEQALRSASLASAERGSNRGILRPWLDAAFTRARTSLGLFPPDEQADGLAGRLSRARLAVLDAVEPPWRSAAAAHPGLGPFAGWVGPATHDDDPRHRSTAITVLENLAACPWQAFVVNVLRARTAHDPLETLPGLAADVLGTLVHRALEQIAKGTSADGDATHGGGWPTPERIDQLLLRAARQLLRERGLRFPALARAAVARARPYVEAAASDWQVPFDLVGTETPFEVTVRDAEHRSRQIHLRVDRVDHCEGSLRLTDYKTGKAFTTAKSASARQQAMLRAVATGQRLQAVAGLEAAHAAQPAHDGQTNDEPTIESRYLYLRPDLDDAVRAASVATFDSAVREAFATTLAVLGAAWDEGMFFPRLSEARADVEPMRCRYCAVCDACVRGDTGARQRQRQWAAATPAADQAARDLWTLPIRGKEAR